MSDMLLAHSLQLHLPEADLAMYLCCSGLLL